MGPRAALWTLAIVAAAVVLFLVAEADEMLIVRADKGRRLNSTKLDARGVVRTPPTALVAEAEKVLNRKIDPDTLALSRMLASEGSRDNAVTRRARAWVAYNDLRALSDGKGFEPVDFVGLFTYSTDADRRGFFGEQRTRRYSTARDSYEGDYNDAAALIGEFLGGPQNDPTRGADKFVDALGLGVQAGSEGNSIASLAEEWRRTPVQIPGAKSDFYVFRREA